MTEQDGDGTGRGVDADEPAAESAEDDETADDETADDETTAAEDLEAIAEDPGADVDEALASVLEEAAPETADLEPDEEVVERVEAADAERLAVELAALRRRVEALEGQLEEREAEVEDLESRLARKQADFQNYKKRQQERLAEEKQRATEALIERLLDVRDNLQRALEQDEDADIRGGVESTLRQLDQEFERENVEQIEPEPGTETDPQRHEVLMRVESDRPAGTVADLHRPGYEMAGKVLRPAQVTVSEGPDEREADAEEPEEREADDGPSDESEVDAAESDAAGES